MCRQLAYLGPPRTLRALLVDPEHSLLRQSWAPRRQRHGTVNADGFGVGWYAEDDDIPARYRRDVPIWSDPSFLDVARVVRSTAVLAAVRSATPGQPGGEGAAAPFADGRWLFGHNGSLPGWPGSAAHLADRLGGSAVLGTEVLTDSGLLWAMLRHRLSLGEPPGHALAGVVLAAQSVPGARLNLLLTDGARAYGTVAGDTLFTRRSPGAVVLASEPFDDDPGWEPAPDGSLVCATTDTVDIVPLESATHPTEAVP